MGVQFILTGEPNQGKTTKLRQILTRLNALGVKTCGFLAPGYWENNQKTGFDLLNLDTGKRLALARTENFPQAIHHGRYYFNLEALHEGESILEKVTRNTCDLVVIDEIGRFELAGSVWQKALTNLQVKPEIPVLIVVRSSLIAEVNEFFQIKEPTIFPFRASVNDIINSILSSINKSYPDI